MKTRGWIKYGLHLYIWLCLGAVFNGAYAQTYTPVPVTGYTQDVIAESGTDATAVTSNVVIDATNHLMYTAAFAATNSIPGGILNSGTIVFSNYTWQLAPFNGNNAFYLSNGALVANTTSSGTLSLVTPASFTNLSLLLFSTEGDNIVSVQINFADGTVYNPGTGTVFDWFDRPGAVYTGFGRIVRAAAPPYAEDGAAQGDGHFYKMDIPIPCANQASKVSSVVVTFSSGTLSGRVVVLALAGVAFSPLVITPTVTDATCGNANGSISLSLNNGGYHSYDWNTTPEQFGSSITGEPAGSYTCIVTDNNNCQTTYQGTIASIPLAVVTATATPATVCAGQSSTLTASATGPAVTGYTWTPGTQTGSPITVTPTANTTYTVTGQDANGCTVSASTSVTINAVPVASFKATPDTICQGSPQTVTFTGAASNTATYDWNGFAGATVQSGSGAGPYSIIFNTPGTYTLQLQVTDGCPSTIATQQVVVDASPTPAFTINPSPICSGDTVSVTFTGAAPPGSVATWTWGGGSVKAGSGFGPYTVKYNIGGQIKLTVTNGACKVNATSHSVTVVANPLAAFTAPSGGCIPAQIPFTNQSSNGTSYTWTFGDGTGSTDPNPSHLYSNAGSYTVTLAVSNNGMCFDTLTETNFINVGTPPVVAFTAVPDTGVLVELRLANFVFTNQSQYSTSYLWHFGDGDSSTQINPSHKYNAPGDYTVTLYASNGGCVDSISHQYYTVIPDKDIRIPNAFSPNGDGINDRWDIDDLKGYPDCTVSVFNRWGQELYRSVGYQNPWNGTYKGSPVPLATYYYVITLPGKQIYKGWVVVLK